MKTQIVEFIRSKLLLLPSVKNIAMVALIAILAIGAIASSFMLHGKMSWLQCEFTRATDAAKVKDKITSDLTKALDENKKASEYFKSYAVAADKLIDEQTQKHVQEIAVLKAAAAQRSGVNLTVQTDDVGSDRKSTRLNSSH